KTESKIFCACSTKFESLPNTNICPVCCGYPGVLPVFNEKVLRLALKIGNALNCKINKEIYFERKSYFYPDLPKNYQISQYKMPLGEKGYLEISNGKKVIINRVHMEEDAGKLIHKDNYSLIDFNRTGTPLIEIVSDPDINSPQEAYDYLNSLKLLLIYIGVSDCDMEKGSLRCDANVSLRRKGATQLGTKVELKNMNTFKGVKVALDYEVKRQTMVINKGDNIIQETRLWDTQKLKTVVMRTKSDAHDYRYFPEPDLLNFYVSDELIESVKKTVGELPLDKKRRFMKNYDILEKEIDVLISYSYLAKFFEEIIQFYPKPKDVSNWLIGPFLEQVNNLDKGFSAVKISAENFSKIVQFFTEGKLNNLGAKKVLSLSITTNEDIDTIIEREKLVQVSGQDELLKFVEDVISSNPKAIQEYLEGKDKSIMFLVGQIMKITKGKANPQVAKDMLERRIKK
ncbi:MAG: Asp-tRNA(Asn)/Glu-tRNA(Gln) amidotransferase subunit GatB, partial [Candidatus Omnitrophica bacterium]|nr:Asp-tRNA(Asn)/Glu-tRNA(Gln) amidotransferase subunit GatB [Candidatus Omnitrophota bacterium]